MKKNPPSCPACGKKHTQADQLESVSMEVELGKVNIKRRFGVWCHECIMKAKWYMGLWNPEEKEGP